MVPYTLLGKEGKHPAIWYDIGGYILTLTELADIFRINHVTLRARLRYRWSIEAACLVPNTEKLSFREVAILMEDPALEIEFMTHLRKHFGRPSRYTLGG